MRRILSLPLLFLIGLTGVASAQAYDDPIPARPPTDDITVLATNSLLGGLTGGLAGWFRGESAVKGFARGFAAGALVYAGKRIAVDRRAGAGLVGFRMRGHDELPWEIEAKFLAGR